MKRKDLACKNSKTFFYDDLSVTRGNYFLTLMAAFFITIILFIRIVVSEINIYFIVC